MLVSFHSVPYIPSTPTPLCRFGKKPLETVSEAVRALDYKTLTVDDVSALLSYLPSQDERRKLQTLLGHDNQRSQNAECDCGEASSDAGDQMARVGSSPREGGTRTVKGANGAKIRCNDGCARSSSGGMVKLSKAEQYLAMMVEVPMAEDRLLLLHSWLTLHARVELVSDFWFEYFSVCLYSGNVSLDSVFVNASVPCVCTLASVVDQMHGCGEV